MLWRKKGFLSGHTRDDRILFRGKYYARLIRDGRVIDEWESKNLVVNEGLNYLLGAGLGNAGAQSNWYLGLFTGNYTPVATDTAASFPGNATETNGYTAGARPAFTPGSATGQQISNTASQAAFTFNTTLTIYGAFLASSAVIGGTTGVLFGAAQFGSSKSVVNNDQLMLAYTFTGASS